MAKTKAPTTVNEADAIVERKISGSVSNPRLIEFPRDPHGFTSMLRKEGVRAVGRIKGDSAKMEIFIATLKVLGQHARVKIEDQIKDMEQSAAASKNRTEAEYARSLADQKAEVTRLKALLASAEAAVEAKAAIPGEKAPAVE